MLHPVSSHIGDGRKELRIIIGQNSLTEIGFISFAALLVLSLAGLAKTRQCMTATYVAKWANIYQLLGSSDSQARTEWQVKLSTISLFKAFASETRYRSQPDCMSVTSKSLHICHIKIFAYLFRQCLCRYHVTREVSWPDVGVDVVDGGGIGDDVGDDSGIGGDVGYDNRVGFYCVDCVRYNSRQSKGAEEYVSSS